mmetsp:Transcript_116927/g.377343  ORF Transcript_116927/g.377343 Transcript_116927/m.377343 type:complete len:250 (+) Transcript_116927:1266-2015(+)
MGHWPRLSPGASGWCALDPVLGASAASLLRSSSSAACLWQALRLLRSSAASSGLLLGVEPGRGFRRETTTKPGACCRIVSSAAPARRDLPRLFPALLVPAALAGLASEGASTSGTSRSGSSAGGSSPAISSSTGSSHSSSPSCACHSRGSMVPALGALAALGGLAALAALAAAGAQLWPSTAAAPCVGHSSSSRKPSAAMLAPKPWPLLPLCAMASSQKSRLSRRPPRVSHVARQRSGVAAADDGLNIQ